MVHDLTFEACSGFTHVVAELLNRPRRSLARGFDQIDCSTRSLVSYQVYRQLLGWIDPCSTCEPRRSSELNKIG
jgi:hypothetical protein